MSTTTISSPQTQADPTTTAQATGGKYLTFGIGSEEFGVQILKVREIIGLMDITAVPQMPHYVRGVINLRGKVIPVMSLRLKFGLPEVENTEQTCVIVVDVGRDVGIIVDRVSEVADIPGSSIEPPPKIGHGANTQFILGMGKVNEQVKILLDINAVLDNSELANFGEFEDSSDETPSL